MAVTGSNSQQQPQFIAITGNQSYTNEPLIENSETNLIVVPEVSFFFFFLKKKKKKKNHLLDSRKLLLDIRF